MVRAIDAYAGSNGVYVALAFDQDAGELRARK